jgi:ankyrin repeat protein
MSTSATTSASGASSATSRAYLPSSTQHTAPPGHAPEVGIRLPQTGFAMPPVTGMPAVAHNAPHFIDRPASSSPRSRFCAAVCDGDATTVKNLVRIGQGDVNTIDPATGMSVLLLAALHGHDDIVLLLCKGATHRDLHRTDFHGNSALMLAAGAGHADVVTLLLDRGAKVDQEDKHGNTALMQLAARGQTGIAKRLVDAGADPAHRNHAGQTAAELAMAEGHFFAAAALLGLAPDALASTYTSTAIGNDASTTAAPHAFLASSTVTTMGDKAPASVQQAVAANDLNALKHVLMTLRHSGHDVPQNLARVGKLDTSDPFFADQEGTPLMAAAHHGHETLFPVLLAAGAQIDQAMPDGWTALLFAARQGHVAAVRALIAVGGTDQVDADGDTALIFAARYGHTALVKLLLQAEAEKHHKNGDGDTALIEATWKGDANTVRALLKAKTNPRQCNDDGMTALMLAARDGHVAIVRMLLQAGAWLDHADADGTTALMFAAAQGHGDIVDMLLAEGADPDREDTEGLTALAWAHARGQDAVARSLALRVTKSSAATVSSTSSAVLTRLPRVSTAKLLRATEANDTGALTDLLEELVVSGKNVAREVNRFGKLKNPRSSSMNDRELTPLMLAAFLGYDNLLGLLIDAGAGVNKTDKNGRSPLIWAVSGRDIHCLKTLLQAGARVDHVDAEGWTALMVAATKGHAASLQVLLDGGASVDITMPAGGPTALMWAAAHGYTAIVQTLLQAGADPNCKTHLGLNALQYAVNGKHDETIRLLRTAGAVKQSKKLLRKWFG